MIPIKSGDNLAIYAERQGLVPYAFVNETDSQLWEYWQASNSGKPPAGGTLVLADPLGTGYQHKRNYSVEGRTTDCTFSVRRPIKADGSSVFKHRGVIPVKLKPSCGDGALAPTIKITYTGEAAAAPNETVSSVGAANRGATMRWAGGHYIYNLAVKGKAPGHYRLSFNVAGVEAASVGFTLRGGAASRGVGQRGTPGKLGQAPPFAVAVQGARHPAANSGERRCSGAGGAPAQTTPSPWQSRRQKRPRSRTPASSRAGVSPRCAQTTASMPERQRVCFAWS